MICRNAQHSDDLCVLYDSIVESLRISNKPFYKLQPKAYNIKYVAELHAKARREFKARVESGRDRQGPSFEQKKCAN